MSKIDVKKKQKKDALLNTAFELFTSKGIQETSISDIVERAGVAKGTFYLYFKDKFDIRNLLIAHKSSQLFRNAASALDKCRQAGDDSLDEFENKIIFLVDNIIDQLNSNRTTLAFISKNLSWGYFKQALTNPQSSTDVNFSTVFDDALANADHEYENPELMIFMIVELASSTCYSSILYNEPVPIAELKPYLYKTIKAIINNSIKK